MFVLFKGTWKLDAKLCAGKDLNITVTPTSSRAPYDADSGEIHVD